MAIFANISSLFHLFYVYNLQLKYNSLAFIQMENLSLEDVKNSPSYSKYSFASTPPKSDNTTSKSSASALTT